MLTALCQDASGSVDEMRRGDRLFEVIQILRRATRPLTAADIAEALEVTARTIYRDMAALQARRVPIEGAPGVGYVLRRGFDLPPLMFTVEEVEAIVIGGRLLRRTGDSGLRQAAESVISKLDAVLPESMRDHLTGAPFFVSDMGASSSPAVSLSEMREAVRRAKKVRIVYADEGGRRSCRTIQPVAIAYYVQATLIAAWCELRGDYRHFRADRILQATMLDEGFEADDGPSWREWIERSKRAP